MLADEPTGNLDTRAAASVIGMLGDLARTHGATLVLVTHSPEAAANAERIVTLSDGRVASDVSTGSAG